MRTQVSFVFAAAMIGLVNAQNNGWQTPQPNFNVDVLCSSADDRNFSRVCFTTDTDMSSFDPKSRFNGFMSDDKKSKSSLRLQITVTVVQYGASLTQFGV